MICNCCGFNENKGILLADNIIRFICIRCFKHENLYFNCKIYEKPKLIIQLELGGRLINEEKYNI